MTKQDIVDLELQLIEGIKTGDVPLLDKMLHDELLFMVPDGSVITKAIDLESHRKGHMVIEKLIPHIESVNIVDDTGIVSVVYESKGAMMGIPIEGMFRYIRIWKNFSYGIRVIGGACFFLK